MSKSNNLTQLSIFKNSMTHTVKIGQLVNYE